VIEYVHSRVCKTWTISPGMRHWRRVRVSMDRVKPDTVIVETADFREGGSAEQLELSGANEIAAVGRALIDMADSMREGTLEATP
jgi:hypothetical protein